MAQIPESFSFQNLQLMYLMKGGFVTPLTRADEFEGGRSYFVYGNPTDIGYIFRISIEICHYSGSQVELFCGNAVTI